MSYCDQHTRGALEALFPGAKRRLLGDRWKTWKRSTAKGLAVLEAMRRAGAIPKRKPDRPTPNTQCTARSRRSGERCKNWRAHGTPVCRMHGAGGKGPWNSWKRGDPRLAKVRKLKQTKNLARRQRWAERQERRTAGLLPLSIGFKPCPEPPRTLEQEFRSGRGDRPKPSKPLYEA